MGLTDFTQMLVDSNNNPYGVSGSMALPVGAIGQLVAGVNGATGLVEYLSSSAGALVVTGTLSTTVMFPSELYIANFPAVQAVSGSQLTGSTFSGLPLVGGGVYYGSGNVGSLPAYVRALQTDVSGALYVTTTGSLAVAPGDGAVFPVSVQGTVPVSFAQPIQVWTEGATGVTGSVNVYTSGPQAVTGAVNVYTSGPQSVSSSSPSGFWFAGTVGVSGSYQSGSVATAPIFPVLEGGLDTTGTVRPVLLDPQGRATNPTTGSNVTSVAASTSNQTVLSPNPQRVGATFWNEGSANAYVKFGAVASKTSYTVFMGQKGYYELPFTYQGRVDVLFDGTTGNLRVTELT